MNSLQTKIIFLFKTYRWIALLLIPFVLFILFLINLIFSSSKNIPEVEIVPTITQTRTPTKASPTQAEGTEQAEGETEFDGLELRDDLQKKETRTDGTTVYTFASNNPNRPNITIIKNDIEFVFSRTLSSTDLPLANLSDIREGFGEPERIIKGSKFYGQQASIYVYSSEGMAFIGNPQIDETYEEQHFPAMSVDSYLQRFGDQN